MAKTKMEDMNMDVEEMGAAEQMATKGGRRAPGGRPARPSSAQTLAARPQALASTTRPNLDIQESVAPNEPLVRE